MSTRTEIVRVLERAKGRLLDGNEIYEAGEFENKAGVYCALGELSKNGKGPIIREKPEGGGRFRYGLRPGLDVKKFVEDGLMQAGTSGEPISDPGPYQRFEGLLDLAVSRGRAAVAPPARIRQDPPPSRPEWPKAAPPAPSKPSTYEAAIAELRARRGVLAEEIEKLDAAIKALQELLP